MTAGLTFFKDTGKTEPASANLRDAKVIVYEDEEGNKFALDFSDSLKLSWGKSNLDHTIDTASQLIGSNTFKTAVLNDGTNPITTVAGLLTKLTTGDEDNGVYTKKGVDDAFVKTDGSNATSHTDKGKALSEAILGAKDGQKSILVKELGTFLADREEVKYDSAQNAPNQTAKAFLESKGLGSASADPSAVATELVTNKATALGTAILGVTKKVNNVDKPALETDLAGNETFQTSVAGNSALKTAVTTDTTFKNAVTSTLAKPAEIAAVPALKEAVAANTDLRTAVKSALASDKTFQGNVKIEVNSEEPGFQGAVRGVMSKPVFEIPADENAPLSWDWI